MTDAMEKLDKNLNVDIDNEFNRSEKSENFKMPSFLERYAKMKKVTTMKLKCLLFLKDIPNSRIKRSRLLSC